MVNPFVYSEAVQVHFGVGKFDSLADVLAELGIEKAVIACGRHFAPQAEALKESVPAVKAVFSAVEPNPQLAGAIETARLARETGADAVVLFCHWGCKQTAGAAQLIRRQLEGAGWPVLVLDGDACDRANCMEGQMSTRFSAFLEMVEKRKQEAKRG